MKPSNAAPTPRSHPLRMPEGWEPPVPAWSSTFDSAQTNVSMAVIGFQHDETAEMDQHLESLYNALAGADIRDLVSADMGGGVKETSCIAYWRNAEAAELTLESLRFKTFWETQIAAAEFGLIKECINVPFHRTETLFSGPEHDHGYSQMRDGIEGPIKQHQYWGAMRDRIAHSANNALNADHHSRVQKNQPNHVVVEPHENLCIIRSGQDWSECDAEQLAEYTDLIEPTLRAGMKFLRDEGDEVNCYACRYMKDISLDGSNPKRSCGLAYFRTMKDLEDWAEFHPTHLAIFNTFLSIAPKHGPDLQLRLWHEVSVLPGEGCRAEYINCRPGTGWSTAS